MKTLINKLRKGILIATAVASLGVASCDLCGPKPEPINLAPEASLYVNPTSGQAPLETTINFDGEDENGKEDIVEYRVDIDEGNDGTIDEVITQTNPINTTRNFDYVGDIKISGQVTDTEGATDKKEQLISISSPPINDYVDISGRLEDCENHGIARGGQIRVKNSVDNSILGEYNVSGDFSITLDKLVSELPSGIILEAVTGSFTNPTSFTRVINNLPVGDISSSTDIRMNPAIRPTMYDNPNDSYDDGLLNTLEKRTNFIEHMWRVNFWNGGLKKWNHGELSDTIGHPTFKGIQTSNSFSAEEQDNIENAIRNSGYLKAGEINITKGENHYLELGWGFIRLSNPGEAPGTIPYEQYGSDGYIERFVTNLTHLQAMDEGLDNHEATHGLLYLGHADSDSVVALFNSIMRYTSYDTRYSPPERPKKFTPADIKGNYIIDEPTYQGDEPENNILETF